MPIPILLDIASVNVNELDIQLNNHKELEMKSARTLYNLYAELFLKFWSREMHCNEN